MNRLIVRLYIVEEGIEVNAIFDSMFSFDDNLKVLGSIIDYDFDNCFVYDYKLNIFINKETPLFNLNMPSSRTFYIY